MKPPRKHTANETIKLTQEVMNDLGHEMAVGMAKCKMDSRNDVLAELRARLKPLHRIEKNITIHEVLGWLDEMEMKEEPPLEEPELKQISEDDWILTQP